MGKFLKKIGLHLFCSFLATNLVIYFFIQLSPQYFLDYRYDYTFYGYHINQVNSKTQYNNIIFGDSKGQCISSKQLGPSWLNLSEHASGFFQGYFTIKYFLEKNKIDTLLLYYSPTAVYEFNDLDYLSRTAVPSKFVRFSDLKSLEKVEDKLGYIYSKHDSLNSFQLLYKQLDRELRYARFPFAYSNTFLANLSSFSSPYENVEEKSLERLKFIKENQGQDLCGDNPFDSSLFYTNTQKVCKPDPVNLAYLDSIVSLARADNMVLYLALAPINSTSYKTYKNSMYEKSINEFYKQLSLKYPTIHLINTPVYMPDSTFGDHYLHPNKKGAVLVSNELIEKIRSNKLTVL